MLDDILDQLLAERDLAVKKVEDILRCKAGLERGDEHEVAEFLHRRWCKLSHAHACPWWISEWDQRPRRQYLEKAKELIELCRTNSIKPSIVFEITDLLLKPFAD